MENVNVLEQKVIKHVKVTFAKIEGEHDVALIDFEDGSSVTMTRTELLEMRDAGRIADRNMLPLEISFII